MNAVKRGKIYARERIELGKAAPLPAPFSVQIDICSACNLQCNFCFHSDQRAINNAQVKFGIMSYELFTHIIDDMKKKWRGGGKKITSV